MANISGSTDLIFSKESKSSQSFFSRFDDIKLENVAAVAIPIISYAVGAYFAYQYYQFKLLKDLVIGSIGISYGISKFCLLTTDSKELKKTVCTTIALAVAIFSLAAATFFALSAFASFEGLKLIGFLGHTFIFGNTIKILNPLIRTNSQQVTKKRTLPSIPTVAIPQVNVAPPDSKPRLSDPESLQPKKPLEEKIERSGYLESIVNFRQAPPVNKAGYYNLGNTCFMNAALKMLISNPEFRKSIKNLKIEERPNQEPTCLITLMKILISEYEKSDEEKDFTILRKTLSNIRNHQQFRPFFKSSSSQEDAHEFIIHLLDVLKLPQSMKLGLVYEDQDHLNDYNRIRTTYTSVIELNDLPPLPKVEGVEIKKQLVIHLPKPKLEQSFLFFSQHKSVLEAPLNKKEQENEEDYQERESLRKELVSLDKIELSQLIKRPIFKDVDASDILNKLAEILNLESSEFRVSFEADDQNCFPILAQKTDETAQDFELRKQLQGLFKKEKRLKILREHPILAQVQEDKILKTLSELLEIPIDKLELAQINDVVTSAYAISDIFSAGFQEEIIKDYNLNQILIKSSVLQKSLTQASGESKEDFEKRKMIQKILKDQRIESFSTIRSPFGAGDYIKKMYFENLFKEKNAIDIPALRDFLGLDPLSVDASIDWLKAILEVDPHSYDSILKVQDDARNFDKDFIKMTYIPHLKRTFNFQHNNLSELRSITIRLPRFINEQHYGGMRCVKRDFQCQNTLEPIQLEVFDRTTNQNRKIRLHPSSFVIHTGTFGYGHYYSYIREGEDWFCHNDEIVTKVNKDFTENSTFRSNVYLVDYQVELIN